MVKRCIMIFPEFSNMNIIDDIRDKYDPLSHHVRPHITLIFPFESEISKSELKAHLEGILSEVKPFKISLQGIIPVRTFGNHLFLDITKGKDEIINIYKSLYTGILEPFHPEWLKTVDYYPHMTVGNLPTEEEYSFAIEDVADIDDIFDSNVEKISVDIIVENEDSLLEMDILLI
ncbi:MAG TPA: 2'-5' RNA ligase family protein [Clostridia bacterium]|nr:2'-5' RNA ligase family protein [Clostridia bacterium]